MATIDLDDVNFALRELVRLQLAGDLATEEAWRERQQLLDAVEAHWDDVPELLAASPAKAESDDDGVSPLASADVASRRQRAWAFMTQRFWPRVRELGLVWALLGLTIATCVYVASL